MLSRLPRIRRHSGTSSSWRNWSGLTPAPQSMLAWCSSTCSTSWVRLLRKAACSDQSLAWVTPSKLQSDTWGSIPAGVYPALYAAMLLPAAKSRNNVRINRSPASNVDLSAMQLSIDGNPLSVHLASLMTSQIPTAPFVVASFGVGMFSLLPYFALWSPLPRDERTLPPKSELVSRTHVKHVLHTI
jgi:hypothetical protein